MTGNNGLDWVILTISLFNTILLVWLGMTVHLNAERRTWGVWLGAAGLFVGAAFFVSHTALISQPLFPLSDSTDFWWHAGWGPVILAPFSWYVVVLWYAGYWDDHQTKLHHRHRFWVVLIVIFTVALVGLLFFGNPLPTVASLGEFLPDHIPSVAGIPLLIVVYPVYILLCIGLALDALLRPGPTGRFMGDQARSRARPWLIATSITLMVVSLLVGWVMIWLYSLLETPISWQIIAGPVILSLARFDGVISAFIALAILLLGQAVVSYEIFTGRTLPRRGFLRQWQNAVILATYVSWVVAASLIFHVRPVYSLLLTILLMTLSYALFSWRTGSEREKLTSRLRPFMTSQRLFDRLLEDSPAGEQGMQALLDAFCKDILDIERACLVALGPLAPLAGPPLVYPSESGFIVPDLTEITSQIRTPHRIGLPLNQMQYPELSWAVPLWSERGLIGVLLLGEKCDHGFYTEEEIEIARASGERLIDNVASTEIARRLMSLQRQRLVESQVLDRQTRRVLHDDVLPLLHAALLQLSGVGGQLTAQDSQETREAIDSLSKAHRQISDLLHDMPFTSPPEIARLGLVEALHHLILDEFGQTFDQTFWKVEDKAEQRALHLSPLPAQVIYYAAREAVRNAARHARQGAKGAVLSLKLSLLWNDGLIVEIEDNGGGLPDTPVQDRVRVGQGLALHTTMMAVAGGTLSIESQPEVFTRILLKLPSSAC